MIIKRKLEVTEMKIRVPIDKISGDYKAIWGQKKLCTSLHYLSNKEFI